MFQFANGIVNKLKFFITFQTFTNDVNKSYVNCTTPAGIRIKFLAERMLTTAMKINVLDINHLK